MTEATTAAARAAPDPAPVRQALRELRRSGRRLVQRRNDWVVTATGSTCRLARLTQAQVVMLAAEERIAPAPGGGYVLAPPATTTILPTTIPRATTIPSAETTTIPIPTIPSSPSSSFFLKNEPTFFLENTPTFFSRTGPWLFEAVGIRPPSSRGVGFAGLARRAQAGEGPMSLRQALAGLRLIADAEQSQRVERITMDWGGIVADRKRRRGRDGGLTRTARVAAVRLARVRAAAGESDWTIAWAACIERVSVHTLAKRHGVRRRDMRATLCNALESIAAAYDGMAA